MKLNYKLTVYFVAFWSSLNLLKARFDWFWSLGSFACNAIIESKFHVFPIVGPVIVSYEMGFVVGLWYEQSSHILGPPL